MPGVTGVAAQGPPASFSALQCFLCASSPLALPFLIGKVPEEKEDETMKESGTYGLLRLARRKAQYRVTPRQSLGFFNLARVRAVSAGCPCAQG
jgi:hypothetical protein